MNPSKIISLISYECNIAILQYYLEMNYNKYLHWVVVVRCTNVSWAIRGYISLCYSSYLGWSYKYTRVIGPYFSGSVSSRWGFRKHSILHAFLTFTKSGYFRGLLCSFRLQGGDRIVQRVLSVWQCISLTPRQVVQLFIWYPSFLSETKVITTFPSN